VVALREVVAAGEADAAVAVVADRAASDPSVRIANTRS
jgi:hypothetical protein